MECRADFWRGFDFLRSARFSAFAFSPRKYITDASLEAVSSFCGPATPVDDPQQGSDFRAKNLFLALKCHFLGSKQAENRGLCLLIC
jgi:hypothetical protein